MKKLILGLVFSLIASAAAAQSNPGLYYGQIPTPAQWNSYFAAKQDYIPGALTGPGAPSAGHLVTWGSVYPGVIDGGIVPSVIAGAGVTVTGAPGYTVSLTTPVSIPRSYLAGLTLSTAGSVQTFSVSAGQATDNGNVLVMPFAAPLTKTNASAWVVGTGNGCMDTGSVANATWYHVYLIERTDKTVVDVLCSLSASAPTMPAGYTFFRRIGSMLTNGSAQWTSFVQLGDEFRWATPAQDINILTLNVGGGNFTLTIPPSIPVLARIRGYMSNGSAAVGIVVSSPLTGMPVVGTPVGEYTAVSQVGFQKVGFETQILTQTQTVNVAAGSANTTLVADTYGWIDFRGKNN